MPCCTTVGHIHAVSLNGLVMLAQRVHLGNSVCDVGASRLEHDLGNIPLARPTAVELCLLLACIDLTQSHQGSHLIKVSREHHIDAFVLLHHCVHVAGLVSGDVADNMIAARFAAEQC